MSAHGRGGGHDLAGEEGSACGRGGRALVTSIALGLGIAIALSLGVGSARAIAATLPNGRAYELVSNVPEAGHESLLDGAEPGFAAVARSGDVVDWEAIGACCGANTGAINTYQATRGQSGWQSRAITPSGPIPLVGLEFQETVFWSEDLSQTIFSTPEPYAPGDSRATGSGGDDLYLRGSNGTLTWLSQGPFGSGSGPYQTDFDGATTNAGEVVFTTAEPLTENATGLAAQTDAEYLYARNVGTETTSLIDVDNGGNLIDPHGASLGDLGPPREGIISFGYRGSAGNAISADGSKVFFETPPAETEEHLETHIYMRDLADATTTALDDPNASGSARYEGASADGSLVFFTSDEGLNGASTANELYEFNTTPGQIGQAPSMVAVPLAAGAGVIGVSAISNNGSRVFFVASEVLASNANSARRVATAGQPNLYVYDTGSGETQFVTTLAPSDVSRCKPTCASIQPTGMVGAADIFRPVYSTRDGSVLVFTSSGALTGEEHTPSTTLSEEAFPGEHLITVASTAGFIVGRTIAVGSGEHEELETIEAIDSPTQMTLSEYGPAIVYGLVEEHAAGSPVEAVNSEVYRYVTASGSLSCLSCTPSGVLSTQSASLGEVPGGSYAPHGYDTQMSEDGSRIFFDSPDPLLPAMGDAVTGKLFEPTNVYEWDRGTLSLISGASNSGSVFHGTTPSGADAFFSTRGALTPDATVGYGHIYDARVGGGFAEEEPTADPCAEEACPLPSADTVFFAAPSSMSLDPPDPASGHGPRAPVLKVREITAAQRARIASSGLLMLTVSGTFPGKVIASATAQLHGRRARVASAGTTLRGAAKVTLKLRLSSAARSELRRRGTLTLRLEVSYLPTGEVDIAEVALRMGKKRPSKGGHGRRR